MPNAPVPAAAIGLPSITRRAALGGLATLPAFSLPARLDAAPAERLAELIADWRMKDAEEEAASDHLEALLLSSALPPAFLRVELRAGERAYTHTFRAEADIDRAFGIGHGLALGADSRARYAETVAAFRRQMRRHRAARARLGIDEAQHLAKAAWRAKSEAHAAILQYRPASLDEARAKNAFLLAQLNENHDFTEQDLRCIFGSGVA